MLQITNVTPPDGPYMEPLEDATQSMTIPIPISDTTINKITLAEPIKVWQSNRYITLNL